MTLESLFFTPELHPFHYPIVSAMLNEVWTQTKATPEIMYERVRSGQLFVVGYDNPKQEELKYDRPSLAGHQNKIPVAFLETIDLYTGGNMDCVPKSYAALTNDGHWRMPLKNADTLILVDATVLPTRRGEKGNNEAQELIRAARSMIDAYQLISPFDGYPFIWTYTPDIPGVKRWHEKLGARDSGYKIINARPGFSQPDVNLMDYSPSESEVDEAD
ncbi:hypothetical protein HY495_03110 [Candidatus Woesearchaeota archaeon]|nr:hypothetical protein [Candidatus Woesearchaeota archaeon]